MKIMYLVLCVAFGLLTFVGAGYVLANHGQANARYACVPMVITLTLLALYKNKKAIRNIVLILQYPQKINISTNVNSCSAIVKYRWWYY